jgi:asparagine synthase (glutamine-hydrolysing)
MARLLTADGKGPETTAIFAEPLRRCVEIHDPFRRYRELQARVADRPPADQMLLIDTMVILPDVFLEKVDRATMASSVEARVPFLDHDLVDFCVRLPASVKIPGGRKKNLLKRALRGVVPDSILRQKKLGFNVPFARWLEGPLKGFFQDHAARFQRRCPGVLDQGCVQRLYGQHLERQKDHSFLLWKVLNLMIWANQGHVTF